MLVNNTINSNLTLSFFKLELFKCPLQYYLTSYIGIEQKFYLASYIGRVVHKIYEKVIKNDLSLKEFNKEEIIMSFLLQYINIHTIKKIKEKEINYIELIKKVKYNLHKKLIYFILNYIEKGYDIYTEHKIKIINTKYKFLNEYYNFIIKPDIYLIKNNKIILIDIKTSNKIKKYFQNQLYFYLNFLSELFKNENTLNTGYIYLSRYNNLNKLIKAPYKKINNEFVHYLNNINKVYHKLNIFTLTDLFNFVHSILSYNTKKLFQIKCILFNNYNNLCFFCPIKDKCPILTLSYSEELEKLLSIDNKEEKTITLNVIDRKTNDISITFDTI